MFSAPALRISPDCVPLSGNAIHITLWPGTGGFGTMALVPMHLRLEAVDGSEPQEYRIRDGGVEFRQSAVGKEGEWHLLPAEELTRHVKSNAVVAHWLEHRLGWRRLLRACVGDKDTFYSENSEGATSDRAA